MNRRIFLGAGISAALSACAPIGTTLNENHAFHSLLQRAEGLDEAVIGTRGRAKLYKLSEVTADFPINSLDTPGDSYYQNLSRSGFRGYKLVVDGLVDRPQVLALAHLQRLARIEQITRHDCVEGWSAIAQWQGVQLAGVLAMAAPKMNARFAVFHSFDRDADGLPYYESLSLQQAAHPQTLLALMQNGRPISADRGGPVRLTVPTQLGYKSAKWVQRIELVASFSALGSGNGGYWEDQGYEWYAGI